MLSPELPGPAEKTVWRTQLDDIIRGVEPVPGYVSRIALPRLLQWEPGAASGAAQIPQDLEVVPGIVFGGYSAAALDQFAGFVMFTVMSDAVFLLTSQLDVEFVRPLAPGFASIRGTLVRWHSARTAEVEVAIEQKATVTSRARVMHKLLQAR